VRASKITATLELRAVATACTHRAPLRQVQAVEDVEVREGLVEEPLLPAEERLLRRRHGGKGRERLPLRLHAARQVCHSVVLAGAQPQREARAPALYPRYELLHRAQQLGHAARRQLENHLDASVHLHEQRVCLLYGRSAMARQPKQRAHTNAIRPHRGLAPAGRETAGGGTPRRPACSARRRRPPP
jgi:hypothetical protein